MESRAKVAEGNWCMRYIYIYICGQEKCAASPAVTHKSKLYNSLEAGSPDSSDTTLSIAHRRHSSKGRMPHPFRCAMFLTYTWLRIPHSRTMNESSFGNQSPHPRMPQGASAGSEAAPAGSAAYGNGTSNAAIASIWSRAVINIFQSGRCGYLTPVMGRVPFRFRRRNGNLHVLLIFTSLRYLPRTFPEKPPVLGALGH